MLTKTKKVALLTTGLAGSLLATTVAGVALSSCTFQVVDSSSSGSSADNPLVNDNAAWYTNSIDWSNADQVSTLVIDDQGLVYANPAKTELIGTVPDTTISNLTIPASVRSITGYMDKTQNSGSGTAKGAFEGMESLTSVTFASNTTTRLGAQAFKGCTNLASVSLPPVLNSIGNNAFENCYNLASINLNNVTYVGNNAFKSAFSGIPTATATVDLNSAVYIGTSAFEGSTGLKSIDLSKNTSLHTIGSAAFRGNMFTSIDFSKATKLLTLSATLFENCTALTSVNLPDSIATIEQNAFIGTSSLETVKLPAGLATLGPDVFGTRNGSKSSGLKTIDLSNTKLTQIHQKAFSGAVQLESVSFPANLTSIATEAFNGCSSLTTIDLSNTKVTTINNYAFANTTSLSSIKLPETLTTIGNNVFRDTTNLTSITIPSTVRSIGDSAFHGSGIKTIDLSDTQVTTINAGAYNGSMLEKITLPSSIISIGNNAFVNTSLSDISFVSSSSAASSNARTTGFTNALALQTIGDNAFKNTKVTSIDLSNTKVTTIKNSAFHSAAELTSVTLPTTLTSIEQGAFTDASSLTTVTFSNANSSTQRTRREAKDSDNKLDFSSATSLTSLGAWAFSGTAITEANLANLQLSNSSGSITIPQSAFENATKLAKVTLPNGVTSIGQNAFNACSSLTTLSFGTAGAQGTPNQLDFSNGTSITTIGASAFKGTKFSEVDLTALTKLETVGADAFSSIVGLETVKLSQEQAAFINPGVFSGVSEDGQESKWVITDGNQGLTSITFDSQAFGTSNVTLTPASNLNKFTGVTEMDLSASPISTLAGGVLFDNSTLQTLKLPATASSWKLTDPREYKTAPVGWKTGTEKKLSNLEFSNFTLNSNTTKSKKKPKNSDPLFSQLNATTWSQVASIMNMFGRVEDNGKDTNLLPWKEGFSDPDLTAESVKRGWSTTAEDAQKPGQSNQNITSSSQQPLYKLVNNLTWTYKKESSGSSITLTIHDPSSKGANAYRAGYTGNQYAYFQVGFGESDNKIKTDATVNVTLKLVGN